MLNSPWSQHYRRAIHRSSWFSLKVCLAAFHCRFHLQGWDPWCFCFLLARLLWETAGSGGMKLNENGENMCSWPVSFEMYWRFGMNSKQKKGHLTNTRRGFDQHKMEGLCKTGNYHVNLLVGKPWQGLALEHDFPVKRSRGTCWTSANNSKNQQHGTKPAPSFTHWRDYQWWLDLLLYPMSMIFIGPVCQSPSMNFCPVHLAISWGNVPRLSAQMFR